MPSDPTLSDLFRSAGDRATGSSGIDVNAVIRRSRRRRLPRQVAAGGVTTLAVAGLGITGANFAGGFAPSGGGATDATAQYDSAEAPSTLESAGTAPMSAGIKRAPAEKVNLCGGTLADVAPSETGLVLTTKFPNATAGAQSVDGVVTLTNTGTDTITGYTAVSPAITLSQQGIVLWHSNGPMIEMAMEVNLAPGESMDYRASFTPVICGVEDDSADSFRADLPAAPAGEYQVSAAIDLMGEFDADLVTGPLQTVTLK